MPELPEIAARAGQMKVELVGKTIAGIEVLQPKCLNLPAEELAAALTGAKLLDVSHRGKWIVTETTRGWLLVNLGMGGEIRLATRGTLPEKRRVVLDYDDGTCLSLNFWWFGYVHYAADLQAHPMVGALGPNALDLGAEGLRALLKGQRGRIKGILLDQSRIAGIGNAYVHDILFLARLHPQRPANTLSDAEVEALAAAIQQGLRPSLEKGGAWYEADLHGVPGGFVFDDILVGYREGQPCPECRTPIEKIKTGSTSTFICPHCQPLST